MSELEGTRTISIPSLAFNYVDNRLESIGSGGELYARKRGTHVAHYGTRWHELFGTPERAARTIINGCGGDCIACLLPTDCPCHDSFCADDADYDVLLEWLKGVAE